MSTAPATIARERKRSWGRVTGFELSEWREAFGLSAGVTDRFSDFALPPAGVPPAFAQLLDGAGPGFDQLVVGRQIHGSTVARHARTRRGVRRMEGIDAHLTAETGLLLAVTVADCIPVYVANPSRGVVGLVHAGWRGVAAGILEAAVRGLWSLGGGSAADIVIHCGVGICGDCYEVGPEVVRAVVGVRETAHGMLDLRGALAQRAAALGIGRVSVSEWCTAHDRARFHSHRASHGRDGRQVAFIGRPAA